ncbi:hypothetical protein CDAR_273861 [Caerostris darwini]|uniref:Uncharacterized protein n=1 Tax=Caerostris darwini TaxID=1538125 RepID=A0AAV4RCI7_9ARAC|nr:hypothetical protein CDAR_273861 [Caerostris darwini]
MRLLGSMLLILLLMDGSTKSLDSLRRACQPLSSAKKTALPEGHHLEVGSEVPQGCPPSNQVKSFWTAPGGQARPPLLTPLTVWSVCWSSPGD